jgi:hypothetical protein
MKKVLIAVRAAALLTGSGKADGAPSAMHGVAAPTLRACATHDTTFGPKVTKYRVDKDKLVDLSDLETWIKLRSEVAPISDDLRREIERRSTYRIVEDTSVGLVAIQADAELSDNLPTVHENEWDDLAQVYLIEGNHEETSFDCYDRSCYRCWLSASGRRHIRPLRRIG